MLSDDIVQVARNIGADRQPCSPSELYKAYLQEFPKATSSSESVGATLCYHCINMPARFPDQRNRRKPAAFLTRPAFKRVGHGKYMLLTDTEIERFKRCYTENHPLIYEPAYDVDDLIPRLSVPPVDSPPSPPVDPEQRIKQVEAYITAQQYDRVVASVHPDEQLRALRGLLGIALARSGSANEALEHLAYAWLQGERRVAVARELATLCQEHEVYELAAGPYQELLKSAPDTLTAADYLMIAQLVLLEEFGLIDTERQIEYVDMFCAMATPKQLHTIDAIDIGRENLKLCRHVDNPTVLLAAYQHMCDSLLGSAGLEEIMALLNDVALDHKEHRLTGEQWFDILEEITYYHDMYPGVHGAVVDGYVNMLNKEIEIALSKGSPLPVYTTDARRMLKVLDTARYDELWDRYEKRLGEFQKRELLVAPLLVEEDCFVPLNGKRIALVGGHDTTRSEVRHELEKVGGSVVEVPPGKRFDEKSVRDKVRNCNLVVLIVGYMGHDLSTIVDKNSATEKGHILRIPYRGKSGVCREIMRWAAAH